MKKTVKVISTILLAIMLVASVAGIAFADTDVGSVLDGLENGTADGGKLQSVGANIVSIIQVVGIVVAVIIILVIGIKYMVGSAEEKAEYKKTMIPYIVGAALIFGGTSIVKAIYSMATQIKV